MLVDVKDLVLERLVVERLVLEPPPLTLFVLAPVPCSTSQKGVPHQLRRQHVGELTVRDRGVDA